MSDTHRKGLHTSEELSTAALQACSQFIYGDPGPDGALLIVFAASSRAHAVPYHIVHSTFPSESATHNLGCHPLSREGGRVQTKSWQTACFIEDPVLASVVVLTLPKSSVLGVRSMVLTWLGLVRTSGQPSTRAEAHVGRPRGRTGRSWL